MVLSKNHIGGNASPINFAINDLFFVNFDCVFHMLDSGYGNLVLNSTFNSSTYTEVTENVDSP